jgi:hypothetical protein
MTKWQTELLVSGEKPGRNVGEWDFYLPDKGSLRDLELLITATNGSSGNASNPLIDCITSIELTSGLSRHLINAPALLLYKHRSILDKVAPELSQSEAADATQQLRLPILGGRFKGDPLYGFELSSIPTPMLKVRYNLEKVRAVGADGFVSGSLTITLTASMTERREKANFNGFVSLLSAVNTLTDGSGSTLVKHINTSRLLSMTLYAYKSGQSEGAVCTNVLLEDKGLARTILNRAWLSIQQDQLLFVGTATPYAVNIPIAIRGDENSPWEPMVSSDLYLNLTTPVSSSTIQVLYELIDRP